ncbi:MAG: hypothetical protein RPU60_10120 [Candidatus Sedimenticola sp. (ex Thyasira tokunagai)]
MKKIILATVLLTVATALNAAKYLVAERALTCHEVSDYSTMVDIFVAKGTDGFEDVASMVRKGKCNNIYEGTVVHVVLIYDVETDDGHTIETAAVVYDGGRSSYINTVHLTRIKR